AGYGALEVLDQVLAPHLLTSGGFQTNKISIEAKSVNAIAIDGGTAARAGVATAAGAHRADFEIPDQTAVVLVKGEEVFLAVLVAHGEDAASGDCRCAVRLAELVRGPQELRPRLWPLLQKAFFGGNSVPLRALPLRPVERARLILPFLSVARGQDERKYKDSAEQ